MDPEGLATQEHGAMWIGALHWSGNWKIVVENNRDNQTRITGGINDFDFDYVLKPKEAFATPLFSGAFVEGGFGDAHVPGLQAGAERLRAHGVVVRRVLHDGEGGQAAAGVEPQVQLGGRLLPAVPRPVDAVQAQLDGAGVDGEDVALQAEDEAAVLRVLRE